ncbi:MAG: hypothetical protein L6Q33_00440 [Bacteriovoracaceae bacterium]|nr:hypothetical protein [Bacteriovoracaceae bacterium]
MGAGHSLISKNNANIFIVYLVLFPIAFALKYGINKMRVQLNLNCNNLENLKRIKREIENNFLYKFFEDFWFHRIHGTIIVGLLFFILGKISNSDSNTVMELSLFLIPMIIAVGTNLFIPYFELDIINMTLKQCEQNNSNI